MRRPTPTALATRCRRWQSVPVTLDGRALRTPVVVCGARWYVALRDPPVRVVIVRDATGRRQDAAFFCPDRTLAVATIRAVYARRWTLAVPCHDATPYLGFADPQQQRTQAVRQTAPLAGLIDSLGLLWSARRVQAGATRRWVARPWYPSKTAPAFPDLRTALRVAGWRRSIADPPSSPRRPTKAATPWPDALLATA